MRAYFVFRRACLQWRPCPVLSADAAQWVKDMGVAARILYSPNINYYVRLMAWRDMRRSAKPLCLKSLGRV
eukprot:1046575-Amphidinium_carterae.1